MNLKHEFPIIADYITSVHKKKIYNHTWLSGANTTVYPITLWSNSLTIQLKDNIRRNTIENFGKDLLAQFNIFSTYIYSESDGSCPNTLTLYLRKEHIR